MPSALLSFRPSFRFFCFLGDLFRHRYKLVNRQIVIKFNRRKRVHPELYAKPSQFSSVSPSGFKKYCCTTCFTLPPSLAGSE